MIVYCLILYRLNLHRPPEIKHERDVFGLIDFEPEEQALRVAQDVCCGCGKKYRPLEKHHAS